MQNLIDCNTAANNSKYVENFYENARKYWSNVPATVNGMLGGLGYISAIDIQGSSNFLRQIKVTGNKNALDCGAGIGRVSKNLLMPRFHTVDLVEQDATFAEKARDYCTMVSAGTPELHKRLGEIYNTGLQQFDPVHGKYDLVWSQWVLGHLTDDDLLEFFRKIRLSLAAGGYFILKENVTTAVQVEKDNKDSSYTRPFKIYEKLLKEAGFRIIKATRQLSFPKGLYPVYMIACQPLKL